MNERQRRAPLSVQADLALTSPSGQIATLRGSGARAMLEFPNRKSTRGAPRPTLRLLRRCGSALAFTGMRLDVQIGGRRVGSLGAVSPKLFDRLIGLSHARIGLRGLVRFWAF